MKIKYVHQKPGKHTGNILWEKAHPIKFGIFPKEHPVGGGFAGSLQLGTGENIKKFREKGYWASCFPEGDGITLESNNKSSEQVIKDIKECFGWDVENR